MQDNDKYKIIFKCIGVLHPIPIPDNCMCQCHPSIGQWDVHECLPTLPHKPFNSFGLHLILPFK